jgi:hypothetical protein
MTEYKGIRIQLPESIEDMMLCNEKNVTMFNACFWAFAEHVIDETRKNCRISEPDEPPEAA